MRSSPVYGRIIDSNRVMFTSSQKEMLDLICSEDLKYSMFESIHVKRDDAKCRLEPIGEEYCKASIVAGINKDFKFKKSVDMG